MKLTDALRRQILSLHAGGASRRIIRQLTGLNVYQVGAVIRAAEEAQQQQHEEHPPADQAI